MKISVVHSFYASKAPSGENVVVQLQVDALRQRGHEVDLVAVNTDDVVGSRGYGLRTAVNVSVGAGYDPTERLTSFEPDVVHIHNLFPNFSTKWLESWPGPIVSTVHNFRPVCASGILSRDGQDCELCPQKGQIHGVIHGCYKNSWVATLPLAIRNFGGAANDAVLKRSNEIVVLSERARSKYSEFGIPPSKLSIVPNCVPDTASDSQQSGQAFWLYVGRLSEQKGILPMAQNWPTGVPLVIYGDGEQRGEIEKLAGDYIDYRGPASRLKIMNALRSTVGLTIPSIGPEGMPTVYLEAISAGVPVLVRHGNSAADDVAAFITGVVFNDWGQMPDAVKDIERNHALYGKNARERYLSEFSVETWCNRIETIYAKALATS